MKQIFYLIRKFPEQVALFVFNSGIFIWLSQMGGRIAQAIGFQQAWEQWVPLEIRQIFGDNQTAIQSFFSHSAVLWLIGSMVILVVVRFVKGMIKLAFIVFILLLGIYLVHRYQTTLQGFGM